MEDLFQAMGASPELRKKIKEDYKAQIEYYDSLSNEEKKFEKIVQTFTDDHITKIDEKVSSKEKEIMTI